MVADSRAWRIAVVIPCFRERDAILEVLSRIPDWVSLVFCIDDGCPEATGDLVEKECRDPRVQVLRHTENLGVGAATKTGFAAALARDVDIVVKLDGDNQMDPAEIGRLVRPLLRGQGDYAKGNRFFRLEYLAEMPAIRLVGNAGLSFVSKLSSGYWQLFDPTNGFVAIHAAVLAQLPLEKIDDRYFFESDMLFRLGTLRAVVVDVPLPARYGNEQSHLSVGRSLVTFPLRHAANFVKRIFYGYFLRGFSVASIEWLLGPCLLIFGVVFGVQAWVANAAAGQTATAGTVMLAALPILLGVQMLLSALHFDISNVPREPIQGMLTRAGAPQPESTEQPRRP